ncbi:DNA-binding protein [Microthyrium microscopicum]|uniref:DNA-binding protein n=1 Tax=Microthyrium microscopicum TaxID=703497 RepID=A0A6A6URR3_9PEZI|nr:DNA-binding protein [Microthyrium microscopicum]
MPTRQQQQFRPAPQKAMQLPMKTQQKQEQVQSTVLTQKQSLEIMKILLHTSISSLAYLREMWPEECFGEVHHDLNQLISYDNFVKLNEPTTGQRYNNLRIMKRKLNPCVDGFLADLEKGIFDALKRGYLHALEVIVSANRVTPLEVLEKYMYKFEYTASGQFQGLSLQSGAGKSVRHGSIKSNMKAILMRIIELDRVLPRLPAERYLLMQAHYTEGSPSGYQAENFIPAANTILEPEDTDAWKKEVMEFGEVDTNHYKLTLSGSILHTDGESNIIPRNLTFVEVPNYMVTGDLSDGAASDDAKNEAQKDIQSLQSTPEFPKSIAEESGLHGHETLPTQESNESPHLFEDAMNELKLRALIDNLSQSQLNTETLSIEIETQPMDNSMNTKGKPVEPSKHSTAAVLLEEPIEQHDQKPNGEIVSCICNHNEEEGKMVMCDTCGRWQHFICYGILSDSDPALQDSFSCVKCMQRRGLLLDTEKLRMLALRRQVLYVLRETHGITEEQIENLPGFSAQFANTALEQLLESGTIKVRSSTATIGHRASNKTYIPERKNSQFQSTFNTVMRLPITEATMGPQLEIVAPMSPKPSTPISATIEAVVPERPSRPAKANTGSGAESMLLDTPTPSQVEAPMTPTKTTASGTNGTLRKRQRASAPSDMPLRYKRLRSGTTSNIYDISQHA